MTATADTAVQVCKVLDALEALAVDLACDCDVPPDTLILSAQRARYACSAIGESVDALRRILQISVDAGGGPIPPALDASVDADGGPGV